jgi:site-specific recombinase XerD
MAITESILHYRRHLKRRNYSPHTIKNYMNTLKHFIVWVDVPIEHVSPKIILSYIDRLLDRRMSPKTINCHLDSIRGFYNYLLASTTTLAIAVVNGVNRILRDQ